MGNGETAGKQFGIIGRASCTGRGADGSALGGNGKASMGQRFPEAPQTEGGGAGFGLPAARTRLDRESFGTI